MINWIRLRAIIVKELLAVLQDKRTRFILFGPPLMQLLIFSSAATLDVKNADLMILNHDNGYYTREILQRIVEAKPIFRNLYTAHSPDDLYKAINNQKVLAAIEFQSDFSARIARGEQATAFIILDGRKANAGQVITSYLTEIIHRTSSDIVIKTGERKDELTLVTRNWFNPNLIFTWFIVPNLVASIAFLVGLIVTALTIAREREIGTFDQIIVSPLTNQELLIGKIIPPMLIGLTQLSFFVLCALFIFQVPLRGSLIYLFFSAFFFLLAVVGIGLLISTLAQTQQQAILGAFLFLAPAMLLSGFATPVANMPEWLQPICIINPLYYFLIVVRGVFLKDISFYETLIHTWPMLLIAMVALITAATLFRKKHE